jgi:serine protease Do
VESISEKGYISKPYVGTSVTDVTKEYLIYGRPEGTAIQSVVKDSPAEKAGLQIGDIITKLGETQITGSKQLVTLVADAKIGDELTLTVYRKGKTVEVTVTVGEQVQSATGNNNSQQNQNNSSSGLFPWNPYDR